METLTIKLKNDIALNFLRDLEKIDVIKIINYNEEYPKKKLSEQLKGCLSNKTADKIIEHTKKLRNEWERDIY